MGSNNNNQKYRLSIESIEYSEFEEYIIAYDKSYSDEEFFKKYQTFRDNLGYVRTVNSKNIGYTLGINQFSDMTVDEFSALYLSTPRSNDLWEGRSLENYKSKPLTYPQSIDWRTLGAVTPVKNQDPCSCGWAFASTGAVEGAWNVSGKPLVSLSEQELLDCSSLYGNNGCNGGFVESSLEYAVHSGLTSESNYPYTGYPTICNSPEVSMVNATISHFQSIEKNSLTDLVAAVAISPIAVDVWASDWIQYSSGILTNTCRIRRTNFSALVVGYNLNEPSPYLIVKSSWGTKWGVKGFIYLAAIDGPGTSCINTNPIIALV